MSEIILTTENFKSEVMTSDKPVLIDFWAEWCGPCKMLAPIISEIAEEFGEKLKVGKINVDEQPDLADSFAISSIPTLIIIKDGKPVVSSIGYKRKEELEDMIDRFL